jgi:hypothetical protein
LRGQQRPTDVYFRRPLFFVDRSTCPTRMAYCAIITCYSVEGFMEKQEKIIELLNELKKKQFTGFIRVNFSQGGITRIEKNEEILKKTKIQ